MAVTMTREQEQMQQLFEQVLVPTANVIHCASLMVRDWQSYDTVKATATLVYLLDSINQVNQELRFLFDVAPAPVIT